MMAGASPEDLKFTTIHNHREVPLEKIGNADGPMIRGVGQGKKLAKHDEGNEQ